MRRTWGSFAYYNVVEKTAKGWPHFNLVVSSKSLANAVRHDLLQVMVWFSEHARKCTLGAVVKTELVRNWTDWFTYLLKAKGKAYQVPIDRPSQFRHVRTSQRAYGWYRSLKWQEGQECEEEGSPPIYRAIVATDLDTWREELRARSVPIQEKQTATGDLLRVVYSPTVHAASRNR